MNLNKLCVRNGGLAWLPAALLVTSALASASPIIGTVGINGPGVMTFKSGGANFLQFCTDANATATVCSGPATANGDLDVTGPGTNSFAILTSADIGTVLNTTDVLPPASPFTYLPVGIATSIDHYLTIASQGTWNFQANLLPAATCAGPNNASQACVGEFQLNQNHSNVNVFFDVFGTIINTSDGSKSTLDISFSATYNNTDIATVIARASSDTGAYNPSWAGTISASAVPEPDTALTMLLAGGVLVGLSRIRRVNK